MNAPSFASFRFSHGLLVLAALLGLSAAHAQTTTALADNDEKKAIVYKICRTDKISITIVGEPDLNVGGKRVDANGNVGLAHVGEVKIAGLSVSQAQTAIENAYRDGRILRNPQVTINIEDYAPRTVSVSGMVKQPGTINLPPESIMTIKELILKAGSFSETANGAKVRVSRVLPDGTTKIFTLNVEAMLKGKESKSADTGFVLEPDDIVYVPEKII
jgi:polysaccharide export outer membrane protein